MISSGFQYLMQQPEKPAAKTSATGAAAPGERFWQEFLRVQSDKLFLLVLIGYLHYIHAPENLQSAAIGGLIYALQAQRFRLKP